MQEQEQQQKQQEALRSCGKKALCCMQQSIPEQLVVDLNRHWKI
jgi:hypothetical protein